jgi:hypothetical protein
LPKISLNVYCTFAKDIPDGIEHIPQDIHQENAHLPKISTITLQRCGKVGVISHLVLKKGLGSDPEGSSAWISRLMPYPKLVEFISLAHVGLKLKPKRPNALVNI